ncbi:hypothetical protein K443DRAFT_13902 [Laccaria amethystina LaAM-08-1]|uniref:Uncharacterized protein n=1 Tax=Laccaria amethystina LaAM-08-1 TaxID=1095629 RepID=A0A0C9X6M1_9AGAR|nr:hypothetical protein K443DRAFT_13902 [Laccaria amethystina LaAM-08-1]
MSYKFNERPHSHHISSELYKQGFVEKQGLMLLWTSDTTTSAVPQKILKELDAKMLIERVLNLKV